MILAKEHKGSRRFFTSMINVIYKLNSDRIEINPFEKELVMG